MREDFAPKSHPWTRSPIEERIIKENDGVPLILKDDPSTWGDISIAGKRIQENGVDTFMEMVGHPKFGVVGLRRFDYAPENGVWSKLTQTIETPGGAPQIHMDLGFIEGVNGIRRSLTYHYERGEEVFVLSDMPVKPNVMYTARSIYNSFGAMMGFQSDFSFPQRGNARLHISARAGGAYNVGLFNVYGEDLLQVVSQNNQEIDLGERTSFQLHESRSGRTTVGISYHNDQGEYQGYVLSYPPRIAIDEYAEHIRTRYVKEEDNTVIEEIPPDFYDDSEPGDDYNID